MLIIYDAFGQCRRGARNKHISCFPHFLSNVALQDLGPIDQNYLVFVGVVDV